MADGMTAIAAEFQGIAAELVRPHATKLSVVQHRRRHSGERPQLVLIVCQHVAGIRESPLRHDHRYIAPVARLVHRLGQIVTGVAGPGLHIMMLCNTESPPDLGFHWFFVATQYEAARPAEEPATSHKRPAEEADEEAEWEA
jgi:hypothetical protein